MNNRICIVLCQPENSVQRLNSNKNLLASWEWLAYCERQSCWSTLQLKCSMAMLQWCNRVYYMLTSCLFYLGSISVDDDRIEPWTFILESSTPVNRATAIAQTLQNLLRKLFLNIFSAGVFLTIKEAFFVVSRVELGKKKRKKFFTTSRGKKLAGTMDLDIATYFSNLKMFLLRPTYIGR